MNGKLIALTLILIAVLIEVVADILLKNGPLTTKRYYYLSDLEYIL